MKTKMKRKLHKLKKKHRNGGLVAAPRRNVRMPRRGKAPDWRTTLAALAGGAGGAALGGLVVNQQILSPEAVGIGMMGLGGATAYFADGNTRVLGNSVAAAGAGQLALSLMARKALGAETAPTQAVAQVPVPARITTAPSPKSAPSRKSATGGGVVVDLFRDAAMELDQIDEDEWRFSTRDSAEPEVIDLYDLDPDEDE